MADIVNAVPSNCHILSNSPALHSLKRQQLVQLCKRNGIKATGKNADIVAKLKAHALNHSSLSGQPFSDGEKENRRVAMPRPSEQWSVIEEDSREVERVHLGLRDIREEVENEIGTVSSGRSYGTAHSSGEFGGGTISSKGSSMSSSLKAFATSLKRGGSKVSTAPTEASILTIHTEETVMDPLAATSTPYHAHPEMYPPLPEPALLDADDSRDQSMLELGASTVRLVTSAPMAPSPPALRPFTPASPGPIYPSLPVDEDPTLPGGFSTPNVFSTPSAPTQSSPQRPLPPPFLFGSPAHQRSKTDFDAAAASVLAEMNARLGLTGTVDAVGLDLLQKRSQQPHEAPFSPRQGERSRTEVTNKFDRAHEREFERMEGLGAWAAKRGRDVGAGASKKRKSDALGGGSRRPAPRMSRVVTPGTRRSVVAAAEAEEVNGRMVKRVRISAADTGRNKTRGDDAGGPSDTAQGAENNAKPDADNMDVDEERERERAAIRKKLEISRARRRSSMGRPSLHPVPTANAKKGLATKFGFLSSARTMVRNVWNKAGGQGHAQVQVQASKPASTVPVPKPAPNLLTKPAPVTKAPVKASTAKPTKPPVVKPEPKSSTSVRIPAGLGLGLGLGRKASTRAATGSTVGSASTRSSTTTRTSTVSSAATRLGTVSSTGPRSVSSMAASAVARRAPIPSFQQSQRSGSSVSGTASSRGTGAAGAGSFGFRKADVPGGVRKRTSTLFAPTASSLARMQSTLRPASLAGSGDGRGPSLPPAGPKFTFTSPPPSTGRVAGSIFGGGTPSFSPRDPLPSSPHPTVLSPPALSTLSPPAATVNPKPRALPPRRPRISRSRVIAKLGAQRAASGSSTATGSARRSLNPPKARGSLGARATALNIGGRESVRRQLRQSEVLRRRSRAGGLSLAGERERTPEDEDDSRDDEQSASLDVSMQD